MQARRAVLSLSSILAFRMLGLFMILPVFSLYALNKPYATTTLVGLAFGIYGLTQAIFQMPFGMLSDRVGRKPVIALGLVIFAAGSIVAALSHSVYGLIAGRALQGAGAIGSTILALIADVTRDEQRTKAMAMTGMTIGVAFSLAIILGKLIGAWGGLSAIFWVTASLAIIGLILLHTTVPSIEPIVHQDVETKSTCLRAIIADRNLLRLNWSVLSLHAILTALFLVIPFILSRELLLASWQQVSLYLAVLLIAFMIAVPLIIFSEKKRQLRGAFLASIAVVIMSVAALMGTQHAAILTSLLLLLFFTAFTLIEATLPSWVSKISPIQQKGTAMGLFSSFQYGGIFLGGSLGGWVMSAFGITGVLSFCVIVGLLWLIVAMYLKQPPYLSTAVLSMHPDLFTHTTVTKTALLKINGIKEAMISKAEQLVYLKIDRQLIDEPKLRRRLEEGNL